MMLTMLAEHVRWPHNLVGLVEIMVLVAVVVSTSWLVRAVRQAEQAWWEQCTRSAPALPRPLEHYVNTANRASDPLPHHAGRTTEAALGRRSSAS